MIRLERGVIRHERHVHIGPKDAHSYGVKVALGYALTYPANVERLALDSVVEPNGPDALYFDTLSAVPRVPRSLTPGGPWKFA